MKTMTLLVVVLSGCMMPMHDDGGMMGHGMMSHPMMHAPVWPTVRIDGLEGAHVTMARGVFGDGIDVRAPFQASFQPTGDFSLSGYPFDITLDATASHRLGSDHEVRLKGTLTVPERMGERGILRIAPSDCALRALVRGDLDKLEVKSELLPAADVACEQATHEAGQHEGHETMCGGMKPHHDGGCGGEAHGRRWGWHHHHDAAELTLVVVRS